MNQASPKKEIALTEAVTNSVTNTILEIKKIQDQIKPQLDGIEALKHGLLKLISGICLQEGFNPETEGFYTNADYTTAYIFDLEKQQEPELTAKVTRKRKVAKSEK